MKKKVFYIIIILLISTAISTCILTSLLYYNFYEKEAKDQIKTIVSLASNKPEEWSDLSHIQNSVNLIVQSVNYKIRITVIEETGTVTYDNFAQYDNLENHRTRPEIEKAFNIGYGEDTRFSNTLKNDTYYYAVKLDDNTVLRISRELKSIRNMFISIIPMLSIFFIAIIVISFFVASNITKKLISPINHIATSLDDLVETDKLYVQNDMYDELQPFAHKMREQKQKINDYIKEIEYERDTIGTITENMREGFILLNNEMEILSINASGKRMIGNLKFDLHEHKNIIELTRNADILNKIGTAINNNKHIVYDIDCNSRHYRYYFSPVSERDKNNVEGLMILIEDVTIQKKSEIMRSEFSANVSHELKTPLTTIIGFAEMIKEGLITDSKSIKKYCGMINNEGVRLINLIDDIIRLSKIEEGIDIDDNSIINLKDVSNEVFNLLSAKAKDRNIKLFSNIDNLSMKANKNYINELLYNLVENGIKYNSDGGKVELNINKNKGMINIVVKDSGLGISGEHLDRIFERFYRVDKSRSKETGGTGLGLSIVKHIVDAYHGTIDINSKEGIGTEIKIKFPLN
jgi:two-component system phosphate regulon sensor histidine kinase PhoR